MHRFSRVFCLAIDKIYSKICALILLVRVLILCRLYHKRNAKAAIPIFSIDLTAHEGYQPFAYEKSRFVALHLVSYVKRVQLLFRLMQ